MKKLLCYFLLFSSVLIAGCGGGSDNSDPNPSGTWEVAGYTKTPYAKFTAVLTLSENGNTTNGTLQTSIGSCMPTINFTGSAYQGHLIGSYNVDGIIATIDARFAGTDMAGTYTLYSKACGGLLEGGFTAVKRG